MSSPSELDRIVQAELNDTERRMIKNQELSKIKSSHDVMQSSYHEKSNNYNGDKHKNLQNFGTNRNLTLHQKQNNLLPYDKQGKFMDKKRDHMSATHLNQQLANKISPKHHQNYN